MSEVQEVLVPRLCKIEYKGEFPAEFLPIIKEHVEEFIGFLPRWCTVLNVRWDTDDKYALSVRSEPKYRWITLYVHPIFFQETVEERRVCMYHEFVHAYLEPMADVFRAAVAEIDKGKQDVLNKWWDDASERSVEDLARRFHETEEVE